MNLLPSSQSQSKLKIADLTSKIKQWLFPTKNEQSIVSQGWTFFKNAFFSLLVLALLLLLLSLAPQGSSLIVDLLDGNILNFSLTFLLLIFTAFVVYEYPVYFLYLGQEKNDDVYFYMNNSFSFLGLGVIFYAKDKAKIQRDADSGFIRKLRDLLGIAVFLIALYAFIQIAQEYFGHLPSISLALKLFFTLAIVTYILTYTLQRNQKRILTAKRKKLDIVVKNIVVKNNSKINDGVEEAINEFYKELKTFFFPYNLVFLITTISFLINLILIRASGWHINTLIATILTICLTGLLSILFFINRSYFIYYFKSSEDSIARLQYYHIKEYLRKKSLNDNLSNKSPKEAYLLNQSLVPQWFAPINWFLSAIHWGNFSDNSYYIGFYRGFALLNITFLLLCNLFPNAFYLLNPIPVFIAYVTSIYYIITVLIKHYLYYSGTNDSSEFKIPSNPYGNHHPKELEVWGQANQTRKSPLLKINETKKVINKTIIATNISVWTKFNKFHRTLLPFLPILVLGLFFLSHKIDNGLHTIKVVPESSLQNKLIHLDDKNSFHIANNKPTYIAASGGGLKACVWTMFALNKLDEDCIFLESQAISGVSGGGIGAANYINILRYTDDQNEKYKRIAKVANANILTIDVIFFLGRDLIRELFPGKILSAFKMDGCDRADKKMQIYCQLTTNDSPVDTAYFSSSYRTHYNEVYNHLGDLPNLIINSISTNGQHGVATAYQVDESDFFPGAIDLLDREDGKSLSFAGTVSTTNRFPLVSPTARIEGKGHFLDGGYHDNSGLTTLLHYANIMESKMSLADRLDLPKEKIFVKITNSREAYIDLLFDNTYPWKNPFFPNLGKKLTLAEEANSGEISAVLDAVADTETIPHLKTQELKSDKAIILFEFALPFYLNYSQIINRIGGEVAEQDKAGIIEIIERNNHLLDSLLVYHFDPYSLETQGRPTPPLGRMLGKPDIKFQRIMMDSHPFILEQLDSLKKELGFYP